MGEKRERDGWGSNLAVTRVSSLRFSKGRGAAGAWAQAPFIFLMALSQRQFDYVGDPRLARVPLPALRAFVVGAAPQSLAPTVEAATTRFALATLAEEQGLPLESLFLDFAADSSRSAARWPCAEQENRMSRDDDAPC